MNIVISEAGNVLVDFEVAKDSHVYFNNGAVDFYREWEDISVEDRKKFIKISGLLYHTLNAELSKLAK
jgi:hypothetical protein